MNFRWILLLAALVCPATSLHAQTPEDITVLIDRLVELDSIDLAKGIKFREGLHPPLHAVDADESQMRSLEDPYQVHGKGKPGAAGWYRVSFVVPAQLGRFTLPDKGYNLGIESNVLGAWEIYTYINGKPAGLWSKDGMLTAANQPPTTWMSNAPMPTKPGDRITVAILATSAPLGRGSPEGFGLRHLRLRWALAHTAARRPFYGGVTRPGDGTGLFGVRERLATLQGAELNSFREQLKAPLARISTVFAAAETGKLDELTKAMKTVGDEINAVLKESRSKADGKR